MEAKSETKVVSLVARLVERGEAERAELIESVARRREAGQDVAVTPDGFDWRAFAVDFAEQNPKFMLLAPVSVACYIFLFYELIFGG